jgi:hypothetical protein
LTCGLIDDKIKEFGAVRPEVGVWDFDGLTAAKASVRPASDAVTVCIRPNAVDFGLNAAHA